VTLDLTSHLAPVALAAMAFLVVAAAVFLTIRR
jgi:hypothetical protein